MSKVTGSITQKGVSGSIVGLGVVGSIVESGAAPVAGYPAVLDDGNTVAWFDYLENITMDGSNLVRIWGDKSVEGNDLLQAVGTRQPLWSADGVLFDGIDNFMKCIAFPWNQPEFIYMVMKQITWTNFDYFFDGNALNSGVMFQRGVTPNISLYAGAELGPNINMILNQWKIVRILFNGIASKLQINEIAAITGDAGAANMGGFTLGCPADALFGRFSNIEVKEIIGRSSAVGEAAIYSYLSTKYGI